MIVGHPSRRADIGATRWFIDAYINWFLRVWGARDVRPWRLRAVFIVGLGLICGTTALTGAVPTRVFGHDIFFLLDNGWRVINGQRPHLDYYSPWGPVTFLVTALGLVISGYSVDGIGYGNSLVALLIGSWTFILAKNRLTPPIRLLFSFFLAVLAVAPYSLGLSPLLSSHAMVYNRYGYALLGLIMLESFRSPSVGALDTKAEWIGGVSTGTALSLTLFLKASYFLVAVVVVVSLTALLRRFGTRRIAGMCVGGFFAAFSMIAYLHFDASAILRDLRMAAGARAGALSIWTPISNLLNHPWILLGILYFTMATALLFGGRFPRWRGWRGWRLPVVGAFFFFADIALMSSNAQTGGFPISAVFVLLVLNELIEYHQGTQVQHSPSTRYCVAAALCIGSLLYVPLFVSDLEGLAFGAWNKAQLTSTAPRFRTYRLAPLFLYDTDGYHPRSNGRIYTTYVNDGIELLERVTCPDERVLTMDMVNPFPYAMGRRPPRGGVAAMSYHYLLSDDHRPSDDAYFGDADIVMAPKHHASEDGYYDGFWKAYEPGLRQQFELIAESDWWLVYRRREYPASPGCLL